MGVGAEFDLAEEFRFQPVQPTTLKERIALQIRQAIIKSDLRPGSRIVESKLAKQMNVAQTTVREAIQELESQGFVVKYVNRESVVRKFTVEDLAKLFRLRLELEGLAMELAHSNIRDNSRDALCRCIDQMRQSARDGSIADFYYFDLEFHRQLWALTNNEFVERALTSLTVGPLAFVLVGVPLPLPVDYEQVAEDHSDLVNALEGGTPAAARKLLETKLRHWNNIQMRALTQVDLT
ncbi:MAG: GntR family transcriptional regulator [Acidobacteriota bacterium]